jgi:hypothetical protein
VGSQNPFVRTSTSCSAYSYLFPAPLRANFFPAPTRVVHACSLNLFSAYRLLRTALDYGVRLEHRSGLLFRL